MNIFHQLVLYLHPLSQLYTLHPTLTSASSAHWTVCTVGQPLQTPTASLAIRFCDETGKTRKANSWIPASGKISVPDLLQDPRGTLLMKHLLGAIKATSIALQGPSLELPQSMDHLWNLRNLFQQWRDCEGNGRNEKAHYDAAKLGNIQIEGKRGRPPVASSAYDDFRQTVYLPFLDFVLMDLNERFVGAASSCAQVCKLLPHYISEKDFDDLVQLYDGVLPDGDFSSEFEVWKTCGASPCTPITQKLSQLHAE